MQPVKRLQPRSYHAFRCIGADCEDTCCVGWIVNIDKPTYDVYQQSADPELGSRLRELVQINASNTNSDNHARIVLSGSACPFLAEGLCAIHKKLGAEYLSIMCSQFPRVMNVVDDTLQRSLDLSCPEAARLVLTDPAPIEFDEDEGPLHEARLGHLSTLNTAPAATSNGASRKPYRYFHEIRTFAIWLLQYRTHPLSKRLVILASLCDQLEQNTAPDQQAKIPDVLVAFRDAVDRGAFDPALAVHLPQPAAQLELILELIVTRIGSDFTPPRFLACYQQFMLGLAWTTDSSLDDIGRRYSDAFAQYYSPFMHAHQHMLEHYLVSYVHRTLFPVGAQESTSSLRGSIVAQSVRDQCQLLLIHYAVIQTMLIGLAGFHKNSFAAPHVIQVVQSFAKAFEHSVTFPVRTLELLAAKQVKTCATLAGLIRN